MKNITNEFIEKDIRTVAELLDRYNSAIWENQEGQKAHFDNQPKIVRLAMADVRTGLCVAIEAMKKLRDVEVFEDEEDNKIKI